MNFEFNDDQKLIQQTVKQFVKDNVLPNSSDWDETEQLPKDVLYEAFDLGLMGIMTSPDYGGSGLDYLSLALVIEELAKGDGSLALTVAVQNSLAIGHIEKFGTNEQKKIYLPQLIQGKKIGGWALTEPDSGSDSSSLKTRAIKQGDSWRLNGAKTFITNATTGDIFIIMTLTDPEKKQRGITSFIVEKGDPGFTSGKKFKKMGMRASDTGELIIKDLSIPDSRRLGEINNGFINAMSILDKGRIGIASLSIGLAQAALEDTLNYVNVRQTFGKLLKDHDMIKSMISDMATEIEASKMLIYKACATAQQGKSFSLEASMAKLYASETATRVCNNALQIHGGYGYMREFRLERLVRDAKLSEIGEGTSEIQRLIIAKEILKNF